MPAGSTTSAAARRRRVLPTTSRGRTVAGSLAGLGGGQEPVRAARDELDQQPMQPVHRERAGRAELVATVHQEPQRDRQVIDLHQPRRRDPHSDHRHGNAHRWHQSCVPAQWRRPAPALTASPARRRPARRPRPGVAPGAGRRPRSPAPPKPGPATAARQRATPCGRRDRCRTDPWPTPSPARQRPRSSPTSCAGPIPITTPDTAMRLPPPSRPLFDEKGSATSSWAHPS
jgi:hypothetical protein